MPLVLLVQSDGPGAEHSIVAEAGTYHETKTAAEFTGHPAAMMTAAAESDKLGSFEVAASDHEQVNGRKGMNQLKGMLVQPFVQLLGENNRSAPVSKEEQHVDCKSNELSNTTGNVQIKDNSDGTGAAIHLEQQESEDTGAVLVEEEEHGHQTGERKVLLDNKDGMKLNVEQTQQQMDLGKHVDEAEKAGGRRELSSAAAEFYPESAAHSKNLLQIGIESTEGSLIGVEDEHEWEEGLWESLCKINKEKKRAKKERKKEIKKKKEGKNFALNQTSTKDGFVPNGESFLSDEMCDIIPAFKTNSVPNSPSSRKYSLYSVDYSPTRKAVLAKYGADTSPYYGCRWFD